MKIIPSTLEFSMGMGFNISMNATVVRKVVVQSGGHIEIDSPELQPGSQVEVIVIPEHQTPTVNSLERLIGAGSGCYGTLREADAYLNRLRDEWNS